MTYVEAIHAMYHGHAVVRQSWKLSDVCIVSFERGQFTWLDGHKVLPWEPSTECRNAHDWILADDVRKRDRESREAFVARFKENHVDE
jgi:hypothetical protein